MESASIQRGAFRPQGRPRHAIVSVLLRVAAIAGFAFAGWIALSAMHDSAYAAEQPQHAAQAGGEGSATIRHLTSRPGWRTMTEDVRDVGNDPMRYVRSRQHDLFEDKDRAVGQVREAADAAGVPQVRLPDVRPERPVLRSLVTKVADTRLVQRPAAGEAPEQRADDAGASNRASHRASKDAVSAAPRTGVAATAAAAPDAGDCSRCRGDHRAPAHAPAQPGQDAPQGGGSTGGHPLMPVADLPDRRHPAAPAAVDAGTFQRTALTDVAAPGSPSVVPD